MRKRVLAIVLAGLMMFETGNVAIASELKETVTQQEVIQEISNEAGKKADVSKIRDVIQEETQNPENVQEKEREPEMVQEKEENPESAEDIQNREIPNIAQVKTQELEPGDVYEGSVWLGWLGYEFEEIQDGTVENEIDSEVYAFSLNKKRNVRFNFKLEGNDLFEENDTTTKLKIEIYKVNKLGEEEFEIIKKTWSEQITVGLKPVLFQKELSLEQGIYLIMLDKADANDIYVDYEFWAEDLTAYATSISIPEEIHLNEGDKAAIQVSDVLPLNAELGITWKSDDEDIATVDKNGKVTAKREGECNIFATLRNGKEYICRVYVTDSTVYATSISMQKKMYLFKNKKAAIQVSNVQPLNAKLGITWESYDEDIATVDKNGKVTAKRAGRCKIFATLRNGKEYTCNVYVEDPKFTTNKYVLNKGESKSLKVKYIYRPITWRSSDNKIVKVDQKGKITAKKKGRAKIYAKVGDKTINCSIQVDEPKLNSKSVKMVKGGNTTLKVTGTKQKITWSSSDKRIAVVKAGKVTGKKIGKATITAKVGTSKYTCRIAVVETKLKATSMKIAVNGKRPISTKKKESKIKWSSDNKKIATVNSSGMVTGKKKGTAIITAKIKDVNYTCKVTVENPKLSKKSISLENGKNTVLEVKNTTMNAKWSSSNSRVASVNARGKVVGKGHGSAVITAKIGGKTLTCKVKVYGKKPNYYINMGDIKDKECVVLVLSVKNRGTEPMRVYSKDASLVNKYDISSNRSLTLISFDDISNYNKITPISYVDIQPGKTEYLVYVVNGTATVYDYSTSIYFDFSYDGEDYQARNNRYEGYTYSKK